MCNFYPSFKVKFTISIFSTFQASHLAGFSWKRAVGRVDFCCGSISQHLHVLHLSELSNLKISAITNEPFVTRGFTSPSGSRHNPVDVTLALWATDPFEKSDEFNLSGLLDSRLVSLLDIELYRMDPPD